jgi:hypothetical protein
MCMTIELTGNRIFISNKFARKDENKRLDFLPINYSMKIPAKFC